MPLNVLQRSEELLGRERHTHKNKAVFRQQQYIGGDNDLVIWEEDVGTM